MAALQQYFSSDSKVLNFAGGPSELEAARQFINSYVSNHTNQMIPELLAEGVLSSTTMLVIVNTVYFKGIIECIRGGLVVIK